MALIADNNERKVGVTDGPLPDVTMDCLRFALHFFRPIQMSAQHIYHTALPLSPGTSVLRRRFLRSCSSWEQDWTTRQTSPWGLYDTWGSILTTIRADSGAFSHVAVAGKNIAAVCEDNTINIYDAVTGVLKLSLDPLRRVTKAESSSDGTILFCAHQCSREITLWDMQTGGLIYTFTTEFDIYDIAVSSMGKYLASCSSDGTFGLWEVESRCESLRLLGEPVVSICWMIPEDQIALAHKGTVVVLETTTGKTLHTFDVGECVGGVVFSAGRHGLAVLSTSGIQSRITFIDIRMGQLLFSSFLSTHISCFTFSGGGVVCGTGTGDLRRVRVTPYSLHWDEHMSQLGTMHSIDLLQSGHLVVNVGGSIQVLEPTTPSGTGLNPEISHVYPLDSGRAICASSRARGNADLVDMETMKTRVGYGVTPGDPDSSFTPRILCASPDRRTTILNFAMTGRTIPKPQVIYRAFPEWESDLLQPVLLVALSPGGGELVIVVDSVDGGWGFRVVDVLDGKIIFPATQTGKQPQNIAFTSKAEFYTDHEDEDCRKETSRTQESHPDRLVTRCVRTTFVLNPRSPADMISKLSEERILSIHPYELDKNLEWVVDAKSRRVCWLPPDYVTGIENGHFFVGSSIIMAGRDGIPRKLTFREPRSE